MMRRDAKIGFVVGGILLAVLIVYVSVPSGKKHTQNGVALDEGNKTDQVASNGTPGTSDSNPNDSAKPSDGSSGSSTAGPTTAPVASANSTDPFSSGNANTSTSTDQSKGTAEDKWMLALNHGSVPPAMMTSSAPQPSLTRTASTPRASAGAAESTDVKSPANSTPDNKPYADSTSSNDNTAAPATQPVTSIATSGKMNTHVVQAGETISSIAKVAYGSANYWPYIIRANPGIVANKIRPGMTINLPDAADVKSGAAAGSSSVSSDATSSGAAAAETKIDPNTQYQVQPGDSLAKIAMKLYGSSNKWQPIYDVNKEAIGADPQKLKQKMILKLPEPPTVKS